MDEGEARAEHALVRRACSGDRMAFEAIVRQHAGSVHAIALGYVGAQEADDMTQEVFLRVIQGLSSFNGKSRLATWIFRVATNVGLNHARNRKRHPPYASLAPEFPILARGPGPHAEFEASAERAAFDQALDDLPEEFRAVVVLRIYRGLSFESVASVLGIARPTAESRMARAKDKLRVLLAPWLERGLNSDPRGRR